MHAYLRARGLAQKVTHAKHHLVPELVDAFDPRDERVLAQGVELLESILTQP